MIDAVTSLLENFSHKNRDAGRRLEALLSADSGAFQQAVVQYLLNGGQQQSLHLLIWLLQRKGKLLDLLLNPQLASLEDSIIVAKIINKLTDQLDVQLAQVLKEAPDELAARILRLLAEISDSNRTLPLLTITLREESPELRSKAAFVFVRHCHNSLFIKYALQDSDPKVRASALEGLGLSDYPVDPAAFLDALADADVSVQSQALVACYRKGERKRALQLVADMSRHEESAFSSGGGMGHGRDGARRCGSPAREVARGRGGRGLQQCGRGSKKSCRERGLAGCQGRSTPFPQKAEDQFDVCRRGREGPATDLPSGLRFQR